MSKAFSYEQIVESHHFFVEATERYVAGWPALLAESRTELDARYQKLTEKYYNRERTKLSQKRIVAAKGQWSEQADALTRSVNFKLRAVSDKSRKDYFGDTKTASLRKVSDRVTLFTRFLEVAKQRGRGELDAATLKEIEALKAAGEALLKQDADFAVVRVETKETQDLRGAWSQQYQRMKYYLRGYYLDGEIDDTIFFKDGTVSGRSAKSAPTTAPATPTGAK